MLELRFERGVGKWDEKTRSFGELKTLYNDNRTIRDNRAYVKKWRGFPDGSAGKESACNAGDTGDVGLIPGLGRFPGGRDGKPLQYSCVENPMARGAWQATVHGGASLTWLEWLGMQKSERLCDGAKRELKGTTTWGEGARDIGRFLVSPVHAEATRLCLTEKMLGKYWRSK